MPAPTGPGSGSRASRSSAAPATIPRPDIGIGLQPIFQSLRSGSISFLGVIEPWEVWWSKNRDKYLAFRESINWVQIVGGDTTQSVTVDPLYDKLLNALSEGLLNGDNSSGCISCPAAIALGKINAIQSRLTPADILKKAVDSKARDCTKNKVLLGLGLAGDTSSAKLLKETALNKKEDPLKRSSAVLGLGYMPNDPEIPKILRDILSDRDDNEVKSCACISLGNLKDASAVPLLGNILNLLNRDGKREWPTLRAYAALGLGRIGAKPALEELKKSTLTKEKEADVRSAVIIALGMTGRPEAKDLLIPFLQDRYPIVRGLAAISLAQIKDAKSYETISAVLQKNKSIEADGLIIIALGLTGDNRAKADLRKILEDKKSRQLLKAAAAIGLGLLKDTEAVPTIVKMLKNEKQLDDYILTPYLIMSLGMIQDKRGIEPLQAIWEKIAPYNAPLFGYHTNLAVALTMLGKRKDLVLPRLIDQINQSKDILLRSHALHTLGLVGDKESARYLVEASNDKTGYIRFAAINGIGFLLDKNPVNPMAKVISDDIDAQMKIIDDILQMQVW